MYSSQSLRGSWWDSRKIEKKKKRKANGATEHLWHASYKSHISVVAGEEQHFGVRSSGKKKKNTNDRVIYVAESNHTKREHLPIIPYMETYMRVEWGYKAWCNAPAHRELIENMTARRKLFLLVHHVPFSKNTKKRIARSEDVFI